MSLCHRVRRAWNAFKNTVYGYDEVPTNPVSGKKRAHGQEGKERACKYDYGSNGNASGVTRQFFQENTSERTSNYCIPKAGNTKYEAYGIEFRTRQERDAFECKMECMEKILEKELYDIKEQHNRLRNKRYKLSLLSENVPKQVNVGSVQNTWEPGSFIVSDSLTSLQANADPLVEEMSLLNELQDVYELMFNLNKELKNIEKVLKIEVRERTLHPEPRLIHVKVPEDELSQQMKSDGGLRYCSSDSSIQQITYDTLPPPLTLEELLAKEQQDAS